MGANSSIPETVTVENPIPPSPPPPSMQLTEDAVNRITAFNDENKEERLRRAEPLRRRSRNSLYEKMSDLEDIQFRETYKKLEEKIIKPMFWSGKVRNQIDEMRSDLIKCNKDNPHEPLVCNEIAERYQNFVFNEFYKTIQEQRPGTKPNFQLVDIHKTDIEEQDVVENETTDDKQSEADKKLHDIVKQEEKDENETESEVESESEGEGEGEPTVQSEGIKKKDVESNRKVTIVVERDVVDEKDNISTAEESNKSEDGHNNN